MEKNIKSYTHVALVLDASGSMGGLKKTTISTMKKFFNSLKSNEDKTVIDLWQFHDKVIHLIDGEDISTGSVKAMENYEIMGCTALYDAICIGIDELGKKLNAMPENERPDEILFAILTDGFENASSEFNLNDVKTRIEHQSQKYSWTFRFLAANQDAVLSGREMGLGVDSCINFEATEDGMRDTGTMFSELVCYKMRKSARLKREGKKSFLTLENQ